MINEAEKNQKLTKDKIVLEATSGNTGIGLALICAVKSYKLACVMSESASLERRKILKAMGAEIILTKKELGTDGAIEEAYKIERENPNKYFLIDQFNNDANWKAHFYTTAPEILNALNGDLDYIIATMGTTGTVMGIAKKIIEYNKENNKNIKVIGVEPLLGHKIQGLKNMKESYSPGIFNKKLLSEKVNIEDEEAFLFARRLAKEEGLLVGMSSGAAMAIAFKYAEKIEKGKIVVIFPDSGERYLSTSLFDDKNSTNIIIYNSLKHKKENFNPIKVSNVSIYSCGPTVSRRINLDEMRRFVFSDFVASYFKYKGFTVNHIMNITDLDDKTIQGAEESNLLLSDFTKEKKEKFFKDLEELKINSINKMPCVSEETEEMINIAQKLQEKSFAYEKLSSLYFNISAFKDYGKLSGIDIDKIKLGATVELDDYEKDNPRDFTLFKRVTLNELKRGIFVDTKWGRVRPSLHLQCAAISIKYLGNPFDIHISASGLVFPHNENEVAIAYALNKQNLSNYWLHCEKVLEDGKKIKNNLNLDEILKLGFNINSLRFWLLSTHYRKSLNFSLSVIPNSLNSLDKINLCISKLLSITEKKESLNLKILDDLKDNFNQSMDDDFNFSKFFAFLFKTIKNINGLLEKNKIGKKDADLILSFFKEINTVLKIFNFNEEIKAQDSKIDDLIKKRNEARKLKDWDLSDKIRDELLVLGYKAVDKKIND